MSKVPFIIGLLLLLALQPAGFSLAMVGNLPVEAKADQSAAFEVACEHMRSIDCSEAGRCLVTGHVGCDFNPLQPIAGDGSASNEAAAYRSAYDASKLPLNETFPPLRPPRLS